MAIKAPTAPTPPTPPVSPKAQDNGEGGHNTDTNQGSESTGKEFGIHINVSSPEDKTEKGQKVKQDTNAAGDGQLQKEVITKEPMKEMKNAIKERVTEEVKLEATAPAAPAAPLAPRKKPAPRKAK